MFIKPILERPKSVSLMWPMEVMSRLEEKEPPRCPPLLAWSSPSPSQPSPCPFVGPTPVLTCRV